MAKWFENESVRKKNGDRAERNWIMDMECMESSLRLCQLMTVPLLAVLTKIEQY